MNPEIDPYDHDHFVQTYRDRLSSIMAAYQGFMLDTLNGILRQINIEGGVPISDVSSRIKKVASVRNKLKRKSYSRPLDEMQDLLGMRVVTAFSMDVEKVAGALREYFMGSGFEVDNYDDKTMGLGIDRFGYRSWHMNVRPTEAAMKIAPWNTIGVPIWCEIQIRTLLQWGWADASHQLVYKGAAPRTIHRRINAVSAILEMSDENLSLTRKEIDAYKTGVRDRLAMGRADDEANVYSVGVFVSHLAGSASERITPGLWGLDDWFECGIRAGMLKHEEREEGQDHRYDAISVARLTLVLNELEVRSLLDLIEILKVVQPVAETHLAEFVRDLVAHGGHFNADAIDAMDIAVSMESTRGSEWRWGRLPEDFDWSGDVADRPIAQILSALRRVVLGVGRLRGAAQHQG